MASDPFPGRLVSGTELEQFAAGAHPATVRDGPNRGFRLLGASAATRYGASRVPTAVVARAVGTPAARVTAWSRGCGSVTATVLTSPLAVPTNGSTRAAGRVAREVPA